VVKRRGIMCRRWWMFALARLVLVGISVRSALPNAIVVARDGGSARLASSGGPRGWRWVVVSARRLRSLLLVLLLLLLLLLVLRAVTATLSTVPLASTADRRISGWTISILRAGIVGQRAGAWHRLMARVTWTLGRSWVRIHIARHAQIVVGAAQRCCRDRQLRGCRSSWSVGVL
jgi:hypothetical protein